MSNTFEGLTSEFLAFRAASMTRRTCERDARVIAELLAAIVEVDRAGGGVTSLGTRGGRETTTSCDGPMTNLEVDLVHAALTAMARRPREVGDLNNARDVGFSLRQLGNWLVNEKAPGMNAMLMGLSLMEYPRRFTRGPYEQPVAQPSGRPPLHLVREPRASFGGAAAAGG